MDKLRIAVRESLQHASSNTVSDLDTNPVATPGFLDKLWRDISSYDVEDNLKTTESLIIARSILRAWDQQPLSHEDTDAANALYTWLIDVSLPSSEFATALEVAYSADKRKTLLTGDLQKKQSTYSLGVSCLNILSKIFPIIKAENIVDIVTTLASFTSDRDPWTTSQSREDACLALGLFIYENRTDSWAIIEDVLKLKIRPIFAKTKNPAITSAGRKNFHPTPQPRFDPSVMDPETKPWKFQDIYAVTVLDWILTQFLPPSDRTHFEAHFHFLVPAILSLLDDESLSFKVRGCGLLSKFLAPIKACHSDLLYRTNLSSVFDDALTPCLLSLPTITPEDESLQILGVAYPGLVSVFQTRYQIQSLDTQESGQPDRRTEASAISPEDKTAYISRITTILRDNIISSFHHISSTTSSAAGSSISSFPYPRLSAFLLNQLDVVLFELGIHTTKYLQEIIPLLYTTLTNPFAIADPLLLLAGVTAARAVILNAYPRIWRFRGELLGAFCDCWLHVVEEEADTSSSQQRQQDWATSLTKLKSQLQGAVHLLKVAVSAVVSSGNTTSVENLTAVEMKELENWAGVDESNVDIWKEYEDLVNADERLRELLFADTG